MSGLGVSCLAQEVGQVLGDSGIGGVVESGFGEGGTALALGDRVVANQGKETFEQKIAHIVAGDAAANGSGDDPAAAAKDGERHLGGRVPGAGEERFLGGAALLPERMELHGIELGSTLEELLFGEAGGGEIHVVAAKKEVVTHGDAFELELAGALGDGDEGEVGGAAADVNDQDEIAGFDLFAPVRVAFDPGVEGGLRFFEDGDFGVAGKVGGALGEFARGGVEGGWNGDENRLIGKFCFRMAGIPGGAQMQ